MYKVIYSMIVVSLLIGVGIYSHSLGVKMAPPRIVQLPPEIRIVKITEIRVEKEYVGRIHFVEVPRLVETIKEVIKEVPYNIEIEDLYSTRELLERLEYQRWTHQYVLAKMKRGLLPEGQRFIGTIETQSGIIDKYDRVIATVKWLVNEIGGVTEIRLFEDNDEEEDDGEEKEPDWGKGGKPKKPKK